jgi:hypothetical protein
VKFIQDPVLGQYFAIQFLYKNNIIEGYGSSGSNSSIVVVVVVVVAVWKEVLL